MLGSRTRLRILKCYSRSQPYPSFGPSGLGTSAPKKNRLYALHNCGEQEGSPDVVTGMLKVFHIYVLLHPGAILSFVTSFVTMRFDVLTMYC